MFNKMAKIKSDPNALKHIISYLEHDEKRHYEESGKPKDHIWLSVKKTQK